MASLVRNIMSMCSTFQSTIQEYKELPESEQQQVWNDLTGVHAKRRVFHQGKELLPFAEENEPKSLVRQALNNLDSEFKSIPTEKKVAFMKALMRSPDYVNDPEFLIKFLRAEMFDAASAAQRITRHFEEKLKLFGDEALGREITLSDLDEDDMESLNSGYLQVLSEPDHGNRKVLFYYKAVSGCYKKRENLLRAFWYMVNTLSMNEDVQKLGIVNVVYNLGGFPKNGMDYEKSRRFAKLFLAIPVRFNSFYPCLDETAWMTAVETFTVMIDRFLRIRLLVIRGTHDEVVYKLKAVGVPADVLPINNNNNKVLLDSHLKWIEEKRNSESKEGSNKESEILYEQRAKMFLQTDNMSDLLGSTSSFYQSIG